MSDLKFEPIREFDAAGTLVRSGARWVEPRAQLVTSLNFLGGTALVLSGVGFLLAGVSRMSSGPLSFGQTFAMVAVAAFVGAVAFGTRQREVMFDAEGGMNTPYGFPGFESQRAVEGDHRSIMSIEQLRTGYKGHVVRLISISGNTVHLAQNLDVTQSLKIAVQLTHALTELRDAGRPGGGRTARRVSGPPTISGPMPLID